ncbi:DHH family phosphoesterase [Anaerocolumna xylanovorans]|uniref:Cyclic-di-AMP phosphodiesterase n=1 Tax=Anaerocolumna xylanovorans DSM 12503 TaxID=1121345 RepID=A0A1M7Y9T9_9FIRM|nr:DHH family phosphoesterase [Anaerocolumna xylanovorans]SHO49359.1 c-di-AMP phosphodiesterase, consists of a GGDEF-like and DHH domains [Anaerocolumna xylanovorans DSM 12503]
MKKKVKVKGALQSYLRWPLFLSLLLIAMDIGINLADRKAGMMMNGFVVVYIVIAMALYFFKRPSILGDIVRYAADYGQVQKQLLKDMALPYGVLDCQGRLLWGNNDFIEVVGDEKLAKKSISRIFPEITEGVLPVDMQDQVIHLTKDNSSYKILLRKIIANSFFEDQAWDIAEDGHEDDSNSLIGMYIYDETEIMSLARLNQEQRMIVGLLYIDNYEEALESIDEVRRSLLVALVDRKINKYMQSIDAIVKKVEKDKYIFIFKHKYLTQLQNNKFNLLEEVRTINIGNEMSVTISIGLGVNTESYQTGYEYARAAIDLALGRGGDQAVVKDGDKIFYYGGKSIQLEKSTRVKARVKAHALKEFVEAKDKVVIMGHAIGDVDSFGAGIGIYRIAKTLNKKAHIVINEVTTSVRPLMTRFINNPDYEDDMFLKSEQAIGLVDNNTLLVIVDVNRPSYTECKELLGLTRTIVILDHHRQTGEAIENPVLSYIEPYASSSCEMVAEVLQYIGDGLRLKQVEADAMYAGIMIDTNNFLTKTGVRTFEAAAFLRRSGADVTRIRKAFRSDMDEYKAKAEAVSATEVYMEHYAITVCGGVGINSPTVLGAQVANELLNITNIRASFVFTEFNDKIYLSARSIDEVNVQLIMEKLGGGGHMSVAGAQFTGCTLSEAIYNLKTTLSVMKKEGEL